MDSSYKKGGKSMVNLVYCYDKEKVLEKIMLTLNIIIILICIIFTTMIMDKANKLGESLISTLFFLVCITYLVYFIQVNVHEFGHFIFGKLVGYKMFLYQIGVFRIAVVNEKLEISINKMKGTSGCCGMMPTEKPSVKNQILFSSGGLIFNLIGIIIIQLVAINIDNEIYRNIFYFANLVVGIVLLSNAIPFGQGIMASDGKIIYELFRKSNYAEVFIKYQELMLKVTSGTRWKDIDIIDDDIEEVNLFLYIMRLFKAMDSDKYEDLPDIVGLIEEDLEKVEGKSLVDSVYTELGYYYAVVKGDIEKAKTYYDMRLEKMKKDKDINGRRSMAIYEYYINNDKEAARKYCEEGLKVVDKFPLKGQRVMEEKLIKNLLNNIEC